MIGDESRCRICGAIMGGWLAEMIICPTCWRFCCFCDLNCDGYKFVIWSLDVGPDWIL